MGRKWWGVALALCMGAAHAKTQDALCDELNESNNNNGLFTERVFADKLDLALPQGSQEFLQGVLLICGVGLPQDIARGIALLKTSAVSGNTFALELLILGYAGGYPGFPLNMAELMKWVDFALKHGAPSVVEILASDPSTAQYFGAIAVERALLRAASSGDGPSMARLGQRYFSTEQYAFAAPWLRLAAVQGYVETYGLLARLYGQGAGVPKDEKQAFYWGQKALDAGASNAYYDMTNVVKAFAIEKDSVFRWHLRMAEAGVPQGMLYVGDSYDHGDGVAVNEKEAERWWNKAASHGVERARKSLDRLALRRKLRDKENSAAVQLQANAKDGTAASLMALARYLDQTRKFDDAVAAYRDAVKLGSVDAKFALGLKLADPDRTQSQQREGFELIVQAAAEKEAQALQWLRTTYLFGGTVQRNLIAAYALDFLTSYVNDEGVATNLPQYKPTFDDALTAAEVANAQQLVRDMLKPGNFAAALSAVSAN